jgi:hypothetical protein
MARRAGMQHRVAHDREDDEPALALKKKQGRLPSPSPPWLARREDAHRTPPSHIAPPRHHGRPGAEDEGRGSTAEGGPRRPYSSGDGGPRRWELLQPEEKRRRREP